MLHIVPAYLYRMFRKIVKFHILFTPTYPKHYPHLPVFEAPIILPNPPPFHKQILPQLTLQEKKQFSHPSRLTLTSREGNQILKEPLQQRRHLARSLTSLVPLRCSPERKRGDGGFDFPPGVRYQPKPFPGHTKEATKMWLLFPIHSSWISLMSLPLGLFCHLFKVRLQQRFLVSF